MDLSTYIRLLRRWWWLLTLATAVGGGASLWYSLQTPPLYRTTATVMVGQFLNSDNPQAGDFTISQQLAQYYAQMATRQAVLQGTVTTLRLETRWDVLATQVNAMAPAATQSIYITVLDGNPTRAKNIADEIARQLILVSPTPREREMDQQRQFVDSQLSTLQKRIAEGQTQVAELETAIANETSALRMQDLQAQLRTLQDRLNDWQTLYQNYLGYLRGSRTNYLTLTQPAYIPSSPASPATQQNVLLAMAAAFVLAVGAALLMEYLDDRLATPEEAARIAGLPALASVPSLGKIADPADALVVLKDPASVAAEAFGVLRAALRLSFAEHSTSTVLVTSPGPGEGKSLTAANLAASFARSGKLTLLVDADLRQPSIHTLFGVPNETGFATLLQEQALAASDRSELSSRAGSSAGAATVEDDGLARAVEAALLPTALPNLRFLPSGHATVGAGDLLSSRTLDPLLGTLRGFADVVVIDCPPVLPLADTGVLAGKGGVVLMVLDMARTRRRTVRAAVEHLARARATLVGASINRAPEGSHYYYRYYRPGRSGTNQDNPPSGRLSAIRGLFRRPPKRLTGPATSFQTTRPAEKLSPGDTAGR